MSSRRAKATVGPQTRRGVVPFGTAPAVDAASITDEYVEVMALVDCIIAGQRRAPRERFVVPKDRVPHLVQHGHVMSRDIIARMAPNARALWEAVPPRAPGLDALTLVADEDTIEDLWHAGGRILTPHGLPTHYLPADPGPNPLRVVQITEYDPGSSVYRYHSAANTVPGILSAFVRHGHSNPHCDLRQWDTNHDIRSIEALVMTAEVIHCHMDYRGLFAALKMGYEPGQRAAITYHGSLPPGDTRKTFVDEETDRRMGSVRFGARPYHLRWGVEHWLPIPMPVQDYLALAEWAPGPTWKERPFRVAHSPTRREIKGTGAFLEAVELLWTRHGVRVEPVLIEDIEHGTALRTKATCHAVFDSFWLGMQGSGLEGAAMRLPVLAGDPDAQADLLKLGIPVPWTIANDRDALVTTLLRLATDRAYYEAEAARVHDYCRTWHDYPVVGAKYRDILTEAVRGATDSR